MSDPYASMLPALELILEKFRPMCVMEFGVGEYSTEALCKSDVHDIVSIETESHEWAEKARAKFHDYKPWSIIEDIKPLAEIKYIAATPRGKFQLIVIDGAAATRHVLVQMAIIYRLSDIIVLHDSQDVSQGYQHVVMPPGWVWTDVLPEIAGHPWTAVITCNEKVFVELRARFLDDRLYPYTGSMAKKRFG